MTDRGGVPRPLPTATVLYKHATVVATFASSQDINDGAILAVGNKIAWVGPTTELPEDALLPDQVKIQRLWSRGAALSTRSLSTRSLESNTVAAKP